VIDEFWDIVNVPVPVAQGGLVTLPATPEFGSAGEST